MTIFRKKCLQYEKMLLDKIKIYKKYFSNVSIHMYLFFSLCEKDFKDIVFLQRKFVLFFSFYK